MVQYFWRYAIMEEDENRGQVGDGICPWMMHRLLREHYCCWKQRTGKETSKQSSIKNEWQHKTFIFHCTDFDSYYTVTIYYSSAQRTGSDIHDEWTVSATREAVVYNNVLHIHTCTHHTYSPFWMSMYCIRADIYTHYWQYFFPEAQWTFISVLQLFVENCTSERKTLMD